MKAYSDLRGFADPAETVAGYSSRPRFASAAAPISPAYTRGIVPQELTSSRRPRNPRGLIIAVAMSAACWAGVGIAFLL